MTDEIKSIQDEIIREEARLTALDEEHERLSRHIAGLRDRLSSIEKTEQHGLPAQQTILPSTVAVPRKNKIVKESRALERPAARLELPAAGPHRRSPWPSSSLR